jgi:hypothetical protein
MLTPTNATLAISDITLLKFKEFNDQDTMRQKWGFAGDISTGRWFKPALDTVDFLLKKNVR